MHDTSKIMWSFFEQQRIWQIIYWDIMGKLYLPYFVNILGASIMLACACSWEFSILLFSAKVGKKSYLKSCLSLHRFCVCGSGSCTFLDFRTVGNLIWCDFTVGPWFVVCTFCVPNGLVAELKACQGQEQMNRYFLFWIVSGLWHFLCCGLNPFSWTLHSFTLI